ncbi:L-aspartate oxidase [Flavobacterium psychrotrophum]|uniref:L-aspartate oxidase n=1 Tax=Flavobacterium psychrotrophum TaxID=2294119 RepID=UPI000E3117D0|nr:L-aspartate oxidase [Flavobacterium psychrotrophum]
MLKTDILVVGTGIAGLFFAIKTAMKRKDLSITIMTKDFAEVSNTQFAQGGIAAVLNTLEDSFEQHIDDTIRAGGGCSDKEVVRMVVEQAPERLYELIGLGVHFDTVNKGYDLALEGGHSHKRILHHGDTTGEEVERALLATVMSLSNITILEKHTVIDLVVENKTCVGAFYFTPDNRIHYTRFRTLVLSTGGCGQLFKHTTNPAIATADGIAIAYRAGAEIADMQYIQFHPTALYEPGKNPSFLLTEALRGYGAHIVNHEGKRFLFQTDSRGELATRDIVSGAIGEEFRKSGKNCVFLDCRHLDKETFAVHFPAILAYCKSIKLDPFTDLLPITPVAHYQCGGIVVNKNAQSSVNGLYAIGECARTGLHGKNRLASNSLLEAVVYAHQAAQAVCNSIDGTCLCTNGYINKYGIIPGKLHENQISILKKKLQETLQKFYLEGLPESHVTEIIAELKKQAFALYNSLTVSLKLIEILNMLTVAGIIVKQAKNGLSEPYLSENYCN